MNRQQFNSFNNIGQVLTFQKSGSTPSFDPLIQFSSGSKRVSWRLNNGSGTTQIAGNGITYTGFTFDDGLRTIQMRGNSFKGMTSFNVVDDNLFGILDLTPIEDFPSTFQIYNNANLTGITYYPYSGNVNIFQAYSCNLTGNLNLSNLSGLGGDFRIYSNSNLTGITHPSNSRSFGAYHVNNCNLTGNLNLSTLSGMGGDFRASFNSNLTGITHGPSSNNFTNYDVRSCNLTGNLNLTPLSGLGGVFYAYSNSNLTDITHGPSSNNFSAYYAFNCNLTGNLNLSPLSGIGGNFYLMSNSGLTSITHSSSSVAFNEYDVRSCNLIGNHNMSMLQNMGGQVNLSDNLLLTGVTFTPSSNRGLQIFTINTCNIQGTIDLTSFTGIGTSNSADVSRIKINANSGLTNVIFPESNGLYFRNSLNNILNAAFGMYACALGYIDFKPLSGCTLISGTTVGKPRFELFGNGMTTAEVNHILYDFDTISTLNYSGWTSTSGTSSGYIDISGNVAPDGSSGGYNGTASTISLAAKGWTVITD